MQRTMKSIAFTRYGSPDDLALVELSTPSPGPNEVLVKIHASSVNDWDWGLLHARPFINRLLFGFTRPNIKTLGLDIAGTVESTGSAVTTLAAGDRVLGDISNKRWGGFAEYVCVPATSVHKMPANMTFPEAAAFPQAGVLAVQGFIDKWNVQPGQHVLINGAGGGCGTFAIQLAKHLGATVTAVDKASKFETMRAMGADETIDYTQNDFTENRNAYDFILDFAGHHPLLHYKRALAASGKYLMVGGASGLIVQCLFFGPLVSLGSKSLKMLGHHPNKHMDKLLAWYEQGILKPVIDRSFALSEVPDALRYFGEGQCKGKIIVQVMEEAIGGS